MRFLPRRRRPKLDVKYFTKEWRDLQKHCATRKTWPQAIVDADCLLDEALRRSKYKGKTPGERLVSAQRDLSSNDAVWVGHKLRNKIESAELDVRKLKKNDIVAALSAFRQALCDLGALKTND